MDHEGSNKLLEGWLALRCETIGELWAEKWELATVFRIVYIIRKETRKLYLHCPKVTVSKQKLSLSKDIAFTYTFLPPLQLLPRLSFSLLKLSLSFEFISICFKICLSPTSKKKHKNFLDAGYCSVTFLTWARLPVRLVSDISPVSSFTLFLFQVTVVCSLLP